MKKISTYIKNHKKSSIAVVILIILGAWYYHSRASGASVTTYITRPVALGTIQSTVSGTGQVSSSQELAINPKVSGTVTSVDIKNGDTVTAGQVLVTLDSTTAGFDLENAKIALAKLQSSDPVSLSSDQNSASSAGDSLQQAYGNATINLTNSFNDMNPIITGLNDLFYSKDGSPYFSESNVNGAYGTAAGQYRQSAGLLVDKVTTEYNNFRSTYNDNTLQEGTSTIEATLAQENSIAQDLLSALNSTSIAVGYIVNATQKQSRTSAMTTDQNNLSNWLSTTNTDATSLENSITGIQNDVRNVNQANATLTEDQSGSTPLDLQSAELAVAQAQYTYDEYTIRAPFDGVIGNVSVQKDDAVSGSTLIGTLVTRSFISHIALNEVDAAKVAVGQPISVTFNALSNVTATGTVSDVDTVGTVSQGVVSYDTVISFNTTNPEIKAGMSVNATIITSEKDNVVVVPNSAIKTVGSRSYVQVPAAGQTGKSVTQVTPKTVQIGVSDDTNTEITSGLNVGDVIVTRTITSTAAAATAQTNILSSLTGRGGAGGAGGGFGGGTRGGTTGTTGGTARTTAAAATTR